MFHPMLSIRIQALGGFNLPSAQAYHFLELSEKSLAARLSRVYTVMLVGIEPWIFRLLGHHWWLRS